MVGKAYTSITSLFFFESSTKTNATFRFAKEGRVGRVKLAKDGKVYYQSPEAPSETVLTSDTEQGAYVIEPGLFEATKIVISFLVLPRRTKLQGGPPREAVSERDIILNEGGESVTFRSLSGKFLPRDGEKLQQLWMDLDTAVRPV